MNKEYYNQYGINIPKNNRYEVKIINNSILINDNKTGKNVLYDPRNFIYGQMHYEPETDKYPNYVHAVIWHEIR